MGFDKQTLKDFFELKIEENGECDQIFKSLRSWVTQHISKLDKSTFYDLVESYVRSLNKEKTMVDTNVF